MKAQTVGGAGNNGNGFARAGLGTRIFLSGPAAVAGEVYVDRTADPCELYFADFKDVGGRTLPHRMEVRYGDKRYAMFNIKAQQLK